MLYVKVRTMGKATGMGSGGARAHQKGMAGRPRNFIPLDPLSITWKQSKRHRGRPLSITCTIRTLSATETIIMRVSPKAARKLLADLQNSRYFDNRQFPHPINQSLIGTALAQVKSCSSRQVLAHSISDDTWKLSLTKRGAHLLQDDLEGCARCAKENPAAIRYSVIGGFLKRAVDSVRTRRKYSIDIIREGLEMYGPWINAYIDRLRDESHSTQEDHRLLSLLLREANQAGYQTQMFFSRRSPERLLKRQLQAWLIEYCLDYWLRLANLGKPMKIVRRELENARQAQNGEKPGGIAVFKRYLGSQWRTRLASFPVIVPEPITQLLIR